MDGEAFATDGRYTSLPPFDSAEYEEYLAGFDLTEGQAIEILHALWKIMASFVDLGFGVSSVQNFLPALAEISSEENPAAVQQNITTKIFNHAVGEAPAEEGPK